MALIKHRVYSEGPFNPPTLSSSITQLLVASHTAPATHQDVFLRARFDFVMSVSIGSVDPPLPELWWAEAKLGQYLWWSPTGSTSLPSLNGHDEHYLGSRLLTPKLVASPSAPTEYYVTWPTDDALITRTMREDKTTSSFPKVNAAISLWDNHSALDGTFGSVSIFWYWRLFTLWGSTV